MIENGQPVIQQTRLFDPNKDETRAMRTKEDANDYRYFPDPDLPKLIVEKNLVAEIKKNIPEMPSVLKTRFSDLFELNSESCDALTSNKLIADFFVNTLSLFCKFGEQKSSLKEKNKLTSSRAKLVANWMLGDLFYKLNRENIEIDQTKITPDTMANFLMKLEDGTLSNKTAKELFVILWNNGSEKSVNELIESSGLSQIKNNDQIGEFVSEVLAKNSDMVKEILQGKDKALNSLVGQVMKISKGKANPKIVREILLEKIKKI